MITYRLEGSTKDFYNYTIESIRDAKELDKIIDVRVNNVDEDRGLIVNLNDGLIGEIPYSEISIDDRENLVNALVGAVVSVKVKNIEDAIIVLSRKDAQKECMDNYVSKIEIGEIIDARVVHVTKFGAICDIGCGITGFLHIKNISVSRIDDLKREFRCVRDLKVIYNGVDSLGRITLTHKELLGTWMEEVSKLGIGDVLVGKVRSVESYGVFIELTPNLTGLADFDSNVKCGDSVIVSIDNVLESSMKVKLKIMGYSNCIINTSVKYKYTKTSGIVDKWVYSPDNASKRIETVFRE